MKRIVKNDEVVVIKGRYKGTVGTVLKVLHKENRVIVENINKVKKSLKNQGEGPNYQEQEAPIHISNVALFNKKQDKREKVSYIRDKNDKKIRVYRGTKDAVTPKK